MSIETPIIERELIYGLDRDYSISEYDTLDELIANAKLDLNEELVREYPILTIYGNSYGTLGNISTFIGKAKSKKSMLVALFCAVLTGANNIPEFKPGLKDCKGIIFDTEQSKRHSQIQYRRVNKLHPKDLSNSLDYYFLRSYSPVDRLKIIHKVVYETESLGFIVIDGIADLLTKGVNDEEEAIVLTNQLMKWSSERNIHIISILHQNKGNENAKGHIGSLLVQKSETVLSVDKDSSNPKISTVTTPYSRGLEIDTFHFSVDEKTGIPFILEDFIKDKNIKKSTNPFDYELVTNYKILLEVYQNHQEISYGKLNDLVRYTFSKYDIKFGERKCRDWITYYREQNMIYQEKPNKPYKLNKNWE